MIDRSHRFHGRSSLRFVYQRGRTVRTPLCSLKFVRNNRIAAYRAAVVVSRKVSKSAVVRNRIRRRIYEIIRQEGVGITEPYDLVLTVFSEQLAEIDADELQLVIRNLLKRAGVITKDSRVHHAIVVPKENVI